MDFLISSAYAQAAAGQPQPSIWVQLMPLIVLLILFWFMLIRPQMKRNKEHREMLGKISKGDEVVTSGGIAGTVADFGELYVTLEVAENTQIKVQKAAVTNVLPKGTLKEL